MQDKFASNFFNYTGYDAEKCDTTTESMRSLLPLSGSHAIVSVNRRVTQPGPCIKHSASDASAKLTLAEDLASDLDT